MSGLALWRVALGVALALSAGTAAAGDWRMDAGASRLEFRASYQGAPAPGAFREFDARLLSFEPARPAGARLEVRVALASFDMGSREIHDAVREPEWLDLARFDAAEFVSTDIRPAGAGRYLARGTMRIKGVEREVSVPFHWTNAAGAARMRGEAVLDRSAFGIGSGEWATGDTIGLEVTVLFDVRMVPG